MDDLQFYPTPKELAQRAWSLFKNTHFSRVLEPSAGNGDLADAHPWENDRFYRGTHPVIDCCETDVTKHPTLRDKGYQVVGLDFLQFGNAAIYSHIILNPPFAYGAAHVLKAYESLWDGEIVAIINADTIRNPYCRDRQRLVSLIEHLGSYEIIEGAFVVPDAERKTDVDVALVYLKKTADVASDIVGDLIGDLRADAERGAGLAGDYAPEQALALPNSFVENAVVTFNAAVAAMRDAVRYEARARHYKAMIGETMASRCGEQGSTKQDFTTDWVKSELATRYDDLKDRSWAGLLRSADVASRLSSAAEKRLTKEFDQIKKLEFTVVNIRGFMCGLMESQGKIQEDMVDDIFRLISRYHTDNTHFCMGWKSNDRHRTLGMKIKRTRFILPGHGTESYQKGLDWDSMRLLSDFDKVFALLDGEREPEISLVTMFNQHFHALRSGTRVYGTYFSCRYFPGAGTIHFFPTRPDLIDRLNRVVGRRHRWLPPMDDAATQAFWDAYESCAKFDKELRVEVGKGQHSRWDNPFDQLHSDAGRLSAENTILDAMERVYERNGINVGNLLADLTTTHPQLELLAAEAIT